jgi:hypothetical protein
MKARALLGTLHSLDKRIIGPGIVSVDSTTQANEVQAWLLRHHAGEAFEEGRNIRPGVETARPEDDHSVGAHHWPSQRGFGPRLWRIAERIAELHRGKNADQRLMARGGAEAAGETELPKHGVALRLRADREVISPRQEGQHSTHKGSQTAIVGMKSRQKLPLGHRIPIQVDPEGNLGGNLPGHGGRDQVGGCDNASRKILLKRDSKAGFQLPLRPCFDRAIAASCFV